jgi:hypothetical protein
MSKIGFSSNPSNGASHTWRSRRRFNYSSSKGGWQAKGAVPPAPSAPTLNNNTDLKDMNDATGLAAKMRGMAVMYNSYSDFPTEDIYTGSFAYARDTNELYVWTGASPVPLSWYGDRGIVNASSDSTIEYFDITTSGTTSDFGSFPTNVNSVGSTSATTNGTLAVTLGVGTADYSEDMWTYVNVATVGNATEIGALRISQQSHAAVSDATYGVFEFGTPGNIEYVTIATSGTSSTWGADVNSGFRKTGAGDGTYGLFAGARASNDGETHITKLTIATTGSATDHGDLLEGRWKMAGGGDGTYALFAGGGTNRNSAFQAWTNIEYVTVATSSGGTTFGSLSTQRNAPVGSHNDTRLVISGGDTSGRGVGVISSQEYITMGTAGTATSFGNLSSPEYYNSGTSGNAA